MSTPTPEQRKVIDDWAQAIFGSQIAGRYLFDGGEMPRVRSIKDWRSEAPRVDLLAPASVGRLGDLAAQVISNLDRYNVDTAQYWLHGLSSINPYQFKLWGPDAEVRIPNFQIVADAANERGMDSAALMAALFTAGPNPRRSLRPPGFGAFRGFTEWICANAELFSPYIAAGHEDAVSLALGRMETVQLMLFDEEMAHALCIGKVTRAKMLWRHAGKLGYRLLAPQFERHAQHATKQAVRRDALLAMHRLAEDPLDREMLRDWAQTNLATDASAEVQAALVQIAPEPVAFTYELPDVDHDVLPDTAVKNRLAEALALVEEDKQQRDGKGTKAVPLEAIWDVLQGQNEGDRKLRYAALEADHYLPYLDELPAAVQLRIRNPKTHRSWKRPLREHFAAEPDMQPLELWLLLERHWPEWDPHRFFDSREWNDEEYVPFILHHLDHFIDMIPAKLKQTREPLLERAGQRLRRDYFPFRLLPAMPRKAYEKFLALGLQGSFYWHYLADEPELFDDLVKALNSSKWSQRMWSAKWLGHLGDTRAVDPLRQRFGKEKQLEARFAMIEALDALGEAPETYLDEDAVEAEAAAVMAKGLPASLSWLDLSALPPLRWKDGRAVDDTIGTWLIVQAAGLKRTHPTAIARSVLGRMESDTVPPWADAIFHQWMTADQKFVSTAEATENAAGRARLHLSWIERGLRPATNALGELHTEDSLIAHYLPSFAKEAAGSEAASRGVLSLVAIGGTETVVDPTVTYLRRFYGKRAHQARSLLEMLSYIEAPSAAPALLSVSHRFRTKSLQEFATAMAQGLAERKGWTLDDLRWRSVPDGGFDTDGFLVLDFGSRDFVASLAEDLSIALTKTDGVELKKLPAPVAADDSDRASEAKKDFNAAKKAMRTLAKELPSRLHEAMCLRREWHQDEYRRYVLDHPVLRLAATRIVWQQGDDQSNTRLFRPDRFGNVFDVAGNKIGLDERPIVIAHGSSMHAAERTGWTAHLEEHHVRPWFDQFSHTTHRPLNKEQTTFDHFQGAIFDSDKRFVSSLTRLGWQRGDDTDGAFLRNMVKNFPAAGFTAHLNVGGLAVSFIGGQIVVLNLSFSEPDRRSVPLDEVPRILVMETLAEVESFVTLADRHNDGWHGDQYFHRRHDPSDVRADLRVASP